MLNVYTSARAPSFLLKKKLDKKHKKNQKNHVGKKTDPLVRPISRTEMAQVFFSKKVLLGRDVEHIRQHV
jgi:hypothetical protein